jgi:hypothetical protein
MKVQLTKLAHARSGAVTPRMLAPRLVRRTYQITVGEGTAAPER